VEQIVAGAIASAIATGVVVILAGIGEVMGQRTGVMNLGIEGMMSIGALAGVIVVNIEGTNVWLGVAAAVVAGLVAGVVFALITVSFRANQVIAGLAFTFLANGLTGQIGIPYVGYPTPTRLTPVDIPILSDLPYLGRILFSHNLIVYFACILLPIVAYYLLFKTRHGLQIRAAGQNPEAADAHGIHVNRLRFFYVMIGSALAALAGAYLTLSLVPSWTAGMAAGRGWIAIALVIFANWNPVYLVLGGIVFGAANSLSYVVQIQGWKIPSSFLFMLPYLLTLALMLISSLMRDRQGIEKTGIGPAALMRPFYRE
jgi:simple sugar transport system permease protein